MKWRRGIIRVSLLEDGHAEFSRRVDQKMEFSIRLMNEESIKRAVWEMVRACMDMADRIGD